MVAPSTLLSGREIAWPFFAPFAIQFCSQRTQKDLGYRISTLCVGRVETEKNQSTPKRGIKLPTFFVPDSSAPSATMTQERTQERMRPYRFLPTTGVDHRLHLGGLAR
jgi:hypothetical protein